MTGDTQQYADLAHYIKVQRAQIAQAIDDYTKELDSIRERRAILDAEEMFATKRVIKAINIDNPSRMMQSIKPEDGTLWYEIDKYNYYPD